MREQRWRTSIVGVVDDRLAPRAGPIGPVGLHAKLIGCVGFEVIDDRVAGGAGLVVPLPVSLAVTHRVMPGGGHDRSLKQ